MTRSQTSKTDVSDPKITSTTDVSDCNSSNLSKKKKKKMLKGKRKIPKSSPKTDTSLELLPKKKSKKELDISSNTEQETSSQSLRRSNRNK